jgi:Sec-independent protein secretion pathway component TatC
MTEQISPKQLTTWFSVVSAILVLVGIVFAFFGLAILPVKRETLLPWQSAIYGAIMMGWGATLFLAGRLAFRRNDPNLMKALLYGITIWLVVEALFSAYFRVFFNIGVDIAVWALFSVPLIKGIRKQPEKPE